MDAPVMNLGRALEIVASQGWFSKRSTETQKQLGEIAKLRSFAKDDVIYLAGDAPNGVFGLVSGSLNISIPRGDGEDYTTHRAGAGFWVGDLALFSQGVRLVSVRAAEPTTMVHLPARALKRMTARQPSLYADFYALTYENFRTAFQIISNLAISSSDKRLADRLLIEHDALGDADGWLSLSQSELANLTAMSLPTLQRALRRLMNAGLVNQRYARIQVLKPEALQRLCRD
jgi:CRP/FNR family transcriptional regulator, cyclic AMP receptor protein